MDVDSESYPHQLLGLLIHISEADFVSFDLELTGIPSHLPGKEPWKPRVERGRKTLEDRYQETRLAANRYQILQVGITCVRFDYLANKYVLRPYNIILSPLLNEKLNIEREIHIQSGAATFLLSNGFDMGAPFARGIVNDRLEKPQFEDMQLKEKDIESLGFVRRIRGAIDAWKTSDVHMLEITTHTGLPEQDHPRDPAISRFEKRLVHQLVRAEYPELVAIGRIIHYDQDREEENKRRIKKRVKEQIARQTGFRWIFEALAGGDIHEANPFHFGPYAGVNGSIIAHDDIDVKERFDRARERLLKHQPVLVGHNLFTDIVYIYRSFVGELPETLDGFCAALHEGDLNASPTLQEIAERIEKQPLPNIVTHADHPKYHDTAPFHEAGYDSLLTATILLRLSTKIDADNHQQQDSDSERSFKSAVEEHSTLVISHNKPEVGPPPTEHLLPLPQEMRPKKGMMNKKKSKGEFSVKPAQRRFHTSNMFDNLRGLDLNPENEQDKASDADQAATPSWQDESYIPNTKNWVPIETRKREPMELIPAWNSSFWKTFGNTFRVYGTQEAVLKIGDWDI
ncbi:hypothetical protein N0V90_007759 [Kalmusia sp. IMI 367209]|nr:hypothetical protein N0V90_007759 [Kalmusia sp. IMI 367209]